MKQRQRGLATVEFAIIGTVVMVVLFGVIEICRALFVWNTLAEVTRRGARLAAVCPLNHSSIARVAIFSAPGGSDTSPIVNGLATANIAIAYLDAAGAVTAIFTQIEYVRVGVTGYVHTLLIPFVTPTITAPSFSTTLPKESLGYIPETGTRACFGTAI